ncbi:integral membrane protein [Salmonella bongori]|nr:integral membrane protein [Salmonella bongori]
MAPAPGMGWRWLSGLVPSRLSATILPANVPNLVMSGAAEGSYGIHLNYVPYLLLHTPVLGWLKGIVLIAPDLLVISRCAPCAA